VGTGEFALETVPDLRRGHGAGRAGPHGAGPGQGGDDTQVRPGVVIAVCTASPTSFRVEQRTAVR
jgi:hypothetical protein